MARLSLFALVVGVGLMLSLHVLPPTDRISPVRRTLSEYALGPNKWMFDLAVLAVAAGSALLFGELVRRRAVRAWSAPVLLGAVWTVSLIVVVAFTKTNWAVGPSYGGLVHRYASVAGWVALPLAVILVAGAVFPDAAGWRWAARGLGIVTLLWFGAILVGVVNMLAGGGPWWRFLPLGIVERGMAASAVAAIAALVLGLVVGAARPYSATNQTPTAGSVPSLR
ncbi:MAG TPA: DUF998 domain-containing protein [Micromonosporaceae bacterium]|nr:DUF998 domain-containing protein [Micromonosporaceae bacterium]